jgi:hypothetical protein
MTDKLDYFSCCRISRGCSGEMVFIQSRNHVQIPPFGNHQCSEDFNEREHVPYFSISLHAMHWQLERYAINNGSGKT